MASATDSEHTPHPATHAPVSNAPVGKVAGDADSIVNWAADWSGECWLGRLAIGLLIDW